MKKTMGRLLPLLLLLALTASLLAGCGKRDRNAEETKAPQSETTEPGSEATDAEETVLRGKDVTVALLAAGRFDEDAWAGSALEGATRAQEDYGIRLVTMECGGADFDAGMRNAAALADVVVCIGDAFREIVSLAQQHPNVRWIWMGGRVDTSADNLFCVDFRCEEGGFLAGFAAASLSKHGRIGLIGGDRSHSTEAFADGFARGAEACEEQVSAEIRCGSDDRLLQYALELAELGAEPALVLADDPDGVVLKTLQEGGLRMIAACPDAKLRGDALTLCAVELDFGAPLYDALDAYLHGDASFWGTVRSVGLAENCISLRFAENEDGQQAKDALRHKLEDLAQMICDGQIRAG